jgi:hypothetical protein
VGEKLNLFVGHRAALCLDAGEDIAGHIASQKLQLSDEIILRQIPLITEFGHVRANDIPVAVHAHLQASKALRNGGIRTAEGKAKPK